MTSNFIRAEKENFYNLLVLLESTQTRQSIGIFFPLLFVNIFTSIHFELKIKERRSRGPHSELPKVKKSSEIGYTLWNDKRGGYRRISTNIPQHHHEMINHSVNSLTTNGTHTLNTKGIQGNMDFVKFLERNTATLSYIVLNKTTYVLFQKGVFWPFFWNSRKSVITNLEST
ncbi:hypothetical protein RF11_01692 [Thelohanellus kitauei]|uniref:Uncharacterized protein n=1 Tax=Thelohanellus kitauei TaxID=669202 RepID=A0A0C2N3R5_THEKT|nr:hypothetical protein RF11_01692 [Thelohanellus kitauei]